MICITFVANKKRGVGQCCNFLQRQTLAFPDVLGEIHEASTTKRYVLKVDHFSNEHPYVETRYHTAYSMSSNGIC